MNQAFIFPGQGSQAIGMGKDLFETFADAKEVFQEIDDVLEQNLSDLIFNGNIEELTLTSNTQPALMAVSIAIIKVLEKQGNYKIAEHCKYVAGHSLGEYSALCAANVFSISDTAKLLRIRGDSMQNAVPAGEGGMVALIGTNIETAHKIAKEVVGMGEICDTANDNGGNQVVMSGSIKAMNLVIEKAQELKIKRAVKLPVSAPFHSRLMKPAAEKMSFALDNVSMNNPTVELVANVTAKNTNNPKEIKDLLVQQVTGSVRWRESVEFMINKNITKFVEVGSGKVLSGLVKRINKESETINIANVADIEAFLNG